MDRPGSERGYPLLEVWTVAGQLRGIVSLVYKKKKLRGLSPRANYTDRAAAAGRRS